MANVSANVVSVYLSPNKPLRAAVAVDDTIVIKATLADETGLPIDLTGCDVVVTATDREKTRLYTADVLSASSGSIQAVVQPDVPGQYKITVKVSVPLMDDEYTFFLGSFSVTSDGDGEAAPAIRSLTETILAAIDQAQDVADDVSGNAAAAQAAQAAAETAASAAQNSASNAADSSSAAVAAASESAASETNAGASATNAAASASAASTSEENASASEVSAANSATAAAGSASSAQTSAEAAAAAAQAAVSALFAGAQPGQVLVKTVNGYKWDYPSEAGIVSGAW